MTISTPSLTLTQVETLMIHHQVVSAVIAPPPAAVVAPAPPVALGATPILLTTILHWSYAQSMHHLQSFLRAVINTHVLFPHEVAKCSQLVLQLMSYGSQHQGRAAPRGGAGWFA